MATNQRRITSAHRKDSIESTATLWEKFYERVPQTPRDAPFACQQADDSQEETLSVNDEEEYETEPDQPVPASISLPNNLVNESNKPWETRTRQDCLVIIVNSEQNIHNLKQYLQKDFSELGLRWSSEEEENVRLWHFGLSAIHLHFLEARFIDIQSLCPSSSIPFWITFKKEKQSDSRKKKATVSTKPMRRKFTTDFDVSLRYGALNDLKDFCYSPQHSWRNVEGSDGNGESSWFLTLDDTHNGRQQIEWTIENARLRRKKQLSVNNINHSVIVDPKKEGFDVYICQKCNMSEFEANAKATEPNNRTDHRNKYPGNSGGKRPSDRQSLGRLSRPPPLSQTHNNTPRQQHRINYDYYKRVSKPYGCYFSTVQFSLRMGSCRLSNRNYILQQIRQTLSLMIEFFLTHNITVCYGDIGAREGPIPYLFLQQSIPDFPSLIMKYAWQMLSINGYRLQIRIDEQFLQTLFELANEEDNPDELFYRVCVYLSRIFSLKPFVNINTELDHALTESKRKRSDAAYGLVRKIDTTGENEAYIPSVTLTPTTIRIKPLKLCRTNRVLRAVEQFGKSLYHFALVDIREENGRDLQSYHFLHLRQLLLDYLNQGFPLMDNDRVYIYLHHSQSQLRERQFWFYHHNDYSKNLSKRNLSSEKAYEWMGNFHRELNPAKYAARMALCFSTTEATVEVPPEKVISRPDIKRSETLVFTDGCGTMSCKLRDKIRRSRGGGEFSAVQFRYNGAKGVVSLDPTMGAETDLLIRKSMDKFDSDHRCFEVCRVSAARPLYLNRQAILLLSYRKVSDTSFLVLQQQNHLQLIRSFLQNSDAEKLIIEKVPFWFLPSDIHDANIDYIHEPFFRQLLISACLQSTRELLQRTRIRVPRNEGRNMMGIVDEYNVLKPGEVFIQYTILDEYRKRRKGRETEILDNQTVVITKNPCHHPGDVRTFTAVNYPQLTHLKDVVVFSQQGDRPAPHDISGSDLDGDEYLVIWYKDLVPFRTENAPPYDYDANVPKPIFTRPVERRDINDTILRIAEQDCLGRLSNLHLAFADKFGVDNDRRYSKDILSTMELAGAISLEVDSGKTGYHPLKDDEIRKLNDALENKRPDYMDNLNFERYRSKHVLGELFRATKRTLPGWNRLLQKHRHLRHLEVRTHDELEQQSEGGEEETAHNEEDLDVQFDPSFLEGVDETKPVYRECYECVKGLASTYRQEIFEILTLYGLSHESDLWCRNSINGVTGELEDTALTELEQLVDRTRSRFFNDHAIYCDTDKCDRYTTTENLCKSCKERQRYLAVACYRVSYESEHRSEQAPILSLPWLFAPSLLQNRVNTEPPSVAGPLTTAMERALHTLLFEKRSLRLKGHTLQFKTAEQSLVGEADVDLTVCVFIEVLQDFVGSQKIPHWSFILSRFVQNTPSFKLLSNQPTRTNQWQLVSQPYETTGDEKYVILLTTVEWTETEERLMHEYFQSILNICFEEAHQNNDPRFLHVSESIILLLQKMAFDEPIIR